MANAITPQLIFQRDRRNRQEQIRRESYSDAFPRRAIEIPTFHLHRLSLRRLQSPADRADSVMLHLLLLCINPMLPDRVAHTDFPFWRLS